MHASTCIHASTDAASAAISGIGSITPCGYCTAEPTTSTVFSFTTAAIASTSARQSARTRVVCTCSPNSCAGFVERGVRALGDDHLRRRDAALAAAFACGLDRQQDALGATRCHEPGRAFGRVQQSRARADHLRLELGEARECLGVQRVLVQEHLRRGLGHLVYAGAAVVHETEGATLLPTRVSRALGRQRRNDLVLRHAPLGKTHTGSVGARVRKCSGTVDAGEILGAAAGLRSSR